MRRRLRPATVAAVLTCLALGGAVPRATNAPVRLVAISTLAGANGLTVLIESSEPAAYATSQPDPLTVLVDLRNVTADGVANRVARRGRDPVAAVGVEELTGSDGTAVARVRVSLTAPAAHRVRSHRNTIRVEFDRPAAPPAERAASGPVQISDWPAIVRLTSLDGNGEAASGTGIPVATTLRSVRTTRDPQGVVVTLGGDGRLVAGAISEAQDLPPRLVLDFPDVSASVPAVTAVNLGPVERIRVAVHSRTPLVTRVAIDLVRSSAYRVEPPELDERDLRIVFLTEGSDAPPPATRPAAAPAPTPAPPPPTEAHNGGKGQADLAVGTVVLDPMAALRAGAASQIGPNALTTPAVPPAPASASAPRPADPPAPAPLAAPQTSTQLAPMAPPSAAAPRAADPPDPGPQTPPQPPPPRAQPAPLAGERQYTGHAVTLDFQNADLRSVLRTFAEISGLNMVIDPKVQGTVDVSLRDVPWDQALDIILRANKLGYTVEGTVVRIAPLTELRAEAEERQKFAEAQEAASERQLMTKTLSYARASAMRQLLVSSRVVTQHGQVEVDERTNTMIILDIPSGLEAASQLIATLDRPEPQVEVEARIVQTTREFARSLGVQWGVNGRVAPELGNTTPLAFPNRGTLSGRTGGRQGGDAVDPRANAFEQAATAVNLPVTAASSAIGLALGAVNGSFNLDVALSALERTGKGRVLSTPRLSTQNNVQAEVKQGIQIPIQTVSNNTVTVTFKDAALILRVTPQITSANTVIMQVVVENSSPDFSRQVGGIPPIDSQSASTTVQVDDGATTVIGGIFVSREQSVNDRTPLLHRIPLLGWLFKRDAIQDESRELLIFITPRIIR